MGERVICSSSSSLGLVWIIIPLIAVSGLVGLTGTRTSNWVFTSNHYPWVVKNEESLNTSIDGPRIVASMNGSHTLPMRASSKRKLSKLMKLEVSLGQARAAIKEARINGNQTQDPDYVPAGPMYWNANAFQRSYLEMEKQFKVFVYEEGEHPIFHNGPCRSIYAMEGNFIYHMEIMSILLGGNIRIGIEASGLIISCLLAMTGGLNFPRRFLTCTKIPFGRYAMRIPRKGFNPAKDVSFPEILLHDGTMNHLLGGPSPSKRSVLVFFAGGVHGPIRPILLEHWENKDEDVQVHKYLPKSVSYYGMMRKSKYCICASGYEVASPRMVEALYMGCVPVLIKDHYVPPFSDVLNWKSFSVEVTVKDIPNLKKILTGISTRRYIRLHRRGLQVRRHFEVNFPPKRFDVFHMILHSVWLRRLNVHVRDFEAAS
ncbi:exostosin family protein [Actinidia rufa]|uniref:Exostosin family protein n=1 Tax=Actinidia rufa TaxID=165716 RepID=A0A7J0GJ85_9ERIC|nr:exostosin family protein [Actinidia rufa]